MTPHSIAYQALLTQAESKIPNVYSSTFFARRNISIVDQQSRCFSLCWALHKTRRIRAAHHVAIVGGGISGMTCAVALATWTNCLVTVLEEDSVPLRRFRRAAHRYIHPELNHRGGLDGYSSFDPQKMTNFPFMNWRGDYAPAFAEELVRKFERYRLSLNIAFYADTRALEPRASSGGVEIRIARQKTHPMKFDAAILATGFGDERLEPDSHTNDTSYWLSGNPLTYHASPHRKRGAERILVSGNGDSAVIELAQLLIRGFSHENIFSFLPSNALAKRLSNVYAHQIQNLVHRKIELEGGGVESWYRTTRELKELNPGIEMFSKDAFDFRRELYSVLDARLGRVDLARDKAVHRAARIVHKTRTSFESLASIEINNCLNTFNLSKIFRNEIKKHFRRDIQVTVVGRSPTIYSIVQAPINWFLLRILTHFGAIRYHQAELVSSALSNSRIRCNFAGAISASNFHRVITRHGPSFGGFASKAQLRRSVFERFDEGARDELYALRPEMFDVGNQNRDCRNGRLLRAQGRPLPLDDRSHAERAHSVSELHFFAQTALWAAHGHPQYREIVSLYRRLKVQRKAKQQQETVVKLGELSLEVVKQETESRRVSKNAGLA